MKNEMSSADISALVSELNTGEYSLIDAKVGKIYQPLEDEIRLNLFLFGRGRFDFIIQAGKRAHFSQYILPSPKIPQSFPMLLRKHIMGGRIISVKQYDFDRIIEIEFVRGGIETILVAELFAKGNIVLIDKERKIILPMNPVTFKGRRVRSGEIYIYPDPQVSPLEINTAQLLDIFNTSDSDIVRTIATRFNLGGFLSEEICFRAGIQKDLSISEVTEEHVGKLILSIQELFNPLITGNLNPCIVKKDEKVIDVVPFDLKLYLNYSKEYYSHFNKALDEYFGKKEAASHTNQLVAVKKEKVDVLERRLRQQQEAVEKYGINSKKQVYLAEFIYANYQTIDELLEVLKNARNKDYSWDEIKSILKKAKDTIPNAKLIVSIDQVKGIIQMNIDGNNFDIDISKTIPQNAQLYYEKAKKLSKKQEGAIKAIEQTKLSMVKKEKRATKKHRVNVKKHWYDKFRWFLSSDGFLIIGGKDADTNEEIFNKYMEKRDIVLHTQYPGAPLTVIKTQGKEVPQKTLQEAACFVVSYSSIWKSGQFNGDCYWVNSSQVTKTPESGEYIKKGSFIIRGDRNYFRDVSVDVAVGIELGEETRVIGGPSSAVNIHGKHIIQIVPGKFNQNDIAKKLYRKYVEKLGDPSFVKQIASVDKISRFLPPGESDLKV